MTLTLKDFQDAKERIKKHVIQTPMLRLHALDDILGTNVFVKLENLQVTNSFKMRGAMNKILSLSEAELKRGIICSSSGNHGQAVAYAAKQLGIPAVVVTPRTGSKFKRDKIEENGAEIVLCDVDDRFKITKELSERRGMTIVSPFDDEMIMAGQGTIALEILDTGVDLDYLLIPTSGGGMLGGIATAISESDSEIKIYGAEPSNLPRQSKSLKEGKRIKVESKPTIADALVVNQPGEITFPYIQKYVEDVLTVSDEKMIEAQKLLLEKGKILAEVSSCIGIGAILEGKFKPNKDEAVCFLISGGNLSLDQLNL
ncbi:threonine/serine dehydratase [Phocicoccus pinnipedialis]|uniref:threonine ammonia-lyase n=1 Tax=Phocicoccus pinnipedialis TaxID=110845 RepID=A0A6V7R9H1_9BACL|nr:threonine/serine dehydratase [Jeotgalicoccus pinnipedialis]MBP1940221.1 threonine dehydratase [Jeotgalicoccus pinnipedialis]CAD2074089.1 L-threonine dehydratase catabolic TdcB [Jeotgalicoccus pinnipedialis]